MAERELRLNRINFLLTDGELEELNRWAASHRIQRSEAIRAALHIAYAVQRRAVSVHDQTATVN